MFEKHSGFGYCTNDGQHTYVHIYKTDQDKFFCQIDLIASQDFNSLDEVWTAVNEIEEIRKLTFLDS